jgi:hypothetical protein
VLEAAVVQRQGADDVATMIDSVRVLRLLAEVLAAVGVGGAAARWEQTLAQARELQMAVLRRTKHEQPDVAMEQRAVAAQLCIELARQYEQQHQPDRAMALFHEALTHAGDNATVRPCFLLVCGSLFSLFRCR